MYLSKDPRLPQSFHSAVSLHSHTNHSHESLSFIAGMLRSKRFLRMWLDRRDRRCERESGLTLKLDRAYWTPPLNGRLALELEAKQIETMGLVSMVSITDHDNIDAALLLRVVPEFSGIPISVEWTVPFGASKFHIGVHNLPGDQAQACMDRMRHCTEQRDDRASIELLGELHRLPGVLLVFNHPLWNLYVLPAARFAFELDRFLQDANRFLHAFELNGMRTRQENQHVVDFAAKWNQLLISGGDRHGCEPNANLNLTRAGEFDEFVSEIRDERRSTVLFMPQYEEPMVLRLFQNFLDVIREYPEHPEGQRRWDERTFHPGHDGQVVPVLKLWPNGMPSFFRKVFGIATLMEYRPVWESIRSIVPGDRDEFFLAAPQAPANSELSPAWFD
jgi:predicted metal-dependent phosphoesterase TrpH